MSGSTIGRLFCVTTFGESHGPAIGCVVDGCPPGLALCEADIQPDLDRRRPGTSRHVTQRQEPDRVEILSGVFEGRTTGTPIALLIRNEDARSNDYASIAQTFRPGHADYTYWHKYGVRDPRGGGRSSARLTAPVVAAGAIARKWLRERYGTSIRGCMTQLGEVVIPVTDWAQVPHNPFFAPTPRSCRSSRRYMDALRKRRRLVRRAHARGGRRRAGGPGRAAVRQARRRHRLRDDGHQRRQGRRDRRRLRLRSTQKGSEHGDELHAAGLRQQPRRRRARRHLDRPGRSWSTRDQADLEHPPAAPLDRPGRRAGDGRDASAGTIPASASAPRRSPRRCWRWC